MSTTVVRLKRNQKNFISLLMALPMVLLLSGCLFFGDDCKPTPFEKTVVSDVKGGHLYFKLDDLAFLENNKIVYDNIEMSVTLRGPHKTTEDIELSLNGIKLVRKDGGRNVDRFNPTEVDNVIPVFKLQKFYLNGGLPFTSFMTQIKKNKGELKVTLKGKEKHIIAASINFKGNRYDNCLPDNGGETPEPAIETKIDLVTPDAALTASRDVQFQFSSNIQGSTYYCSLDSAAAQLCTSPMSYTGLGNGAHNFSVYAKSPKGAVDATPATYSYEIDAIAPSVTITNRDSLATLTRNDGIVVEFTASEAGAFECRLDENAPSICTSPMSYNNLSEGVHTFYVHAIDSVGNAGLDASFQWRVDKTAPIARIIEASPSAAINNVNTKNFTFAADETSTFECSVDSAAFTACESPLAVSGLVDGSHWFEVRAIDTVGNLGVAASYSWSVDTVSPVINLGAVNPAAGTTNSKNIYVDFTVSEVASTYCSYDQGEVQECSGQFSASDVAEGAHQLVIYAADVAGNRSADVTLNWTMDLTLPVLSFGVITPNAERINSSSLTAEVNSSEQSTLIVKLNDVVLDQSSSPIRLSNLAEGNYVLSVSATDGVGNASQSIQHSFTVDLTAPTISLAVSEQANPSNTDNNSFTFSSNEEGIFECNLDEAGFGECASPHSVSGLADGSHDFLVRAVDLAGNVSAPVSYSWTVDTRGPVTSIAAAQAGNDIQFTLSADESPVTYQCYMNASAPVACGTNASFNDLADGDYTFFAQATDAAGNKGSLASWTFTVRSPPSTKILEVIPAAEVTSNQTTRTISFSSTQEGSSFVCSLNGAAFTPCASPIEYTNLTHGVYNFTVKAVSAFDDVDPVGASVSWVVDTVAPVVSALNSSPTTSSITVTWSTDEAATRIVEYGTTPTFGRSTVETATYSTSHSVTLIGLTRNTLYYIRVKGRDAAGNFYVSPTIQRKTNN